MMRLDEKICSLCLIVLLQPYSIAMAGEVLSCYSRLVDCSLKSSYICSKLEIKIDRLDVSTLQFKFLNSNSKLRLKLLEKMNAAGVFKCLPANSYEVAKQAVVKASKSNDCRKLSLCLNGDVLTCQLSLTVSPCRDPLSIILSENEMKH